MIDHPSSEELAAFVRGGLTGLRTREVVRHLLLPCPPCGALVAEAMGKLLRPDPVEEDEYDAPLDRAIEKVFEQRRRKRQAEAERLERFLVEHGVKGVADIPWETDDLALYDALLARSWACRHDSPALMVQFADMAVKHSQGLDACIHGVRAVADLQSRAWAELGNAHRVQDRFDYAATALTFARQLCESGTGDEVLEIRVTELEASLAADRGHYDVALLKLTHVHEFYERKGARHLAGRTLILKGLYLNYAGETDEAIRLLRQGRPLIDPELDPDLVYCAAHNELLCLTDAGRIREAKRLRVERSRELALGKGRVHQVRLRAVEGRLDAAEWKHGRAEATFREVKQGYGELGRSYHVAITGLDLAAVLMRRERWAEATEEAYEAIKIFLQHSLGQEAYAAVIVLRQALKMGFADAGWVQRIADYMRRVELNPHIPFMPPPVKKP